MATVHLSEPPDCPDGQWCIVCLMDAKQKQWETHQDKIQEGYAAPGEAVIWIPWIPALTKELRAGRYRAVSGEVPMLGVVDGLCWDHVAGTNPTTAPSSLIPAGGRLPPAGLRRGGKG